MALICQTSKKLAKADIRESYRQILKLDGVQHEPKKAYHFLIYYGFVCYIVSYFKRSIFLRQPISL